jgi:prepilin-type N-terminal cleavage/methylation domain-containing protein
VVILKRGFTLVEVIVALFIAAVASVIFFEIISTTLNGIYNTQMKGAQIYKAQQYIENKLAGPITKPSTSITFTFQSTSKSTSITINGTMITDATKTFYVFVPVRQGQ